MWKFKGGFWAGVEIIECLLVGEGVKEEENVNMRKNTFQAEENSEEVSWVRNAHEKVQRRRPRPIGWKSEV